MPPKKAERASDLVRTDGATMVRAGAQRGFAEFLPSTYNRETHEVDLLWTTGAEVLTVPWFEDPYLEELEVTPEACDLSRLNAGAPLLDTHRKGSVREVVGVVVRAWIEDGKGYARVRFSRKASVSDIELDVADGIVRNVSNGYVVRVYRDVTLPTDEIRRLRAVNWQPFELSLCPVGADAEASTRGLYSEGLALNRSGGESLHELRIETGENMPPKNTKNETPTEQVETTGTSGDAPAGEARERAVEEPRERAPQTPAPRGESADEALERGRREERERATGIRQALRASGLRGEELDRKLATELAGTRSADDVRREVLTRLATEDTEAPTSNRVDVVRGEAETITRGLEEGLMVRARAVDVAKASENGRRFRNLNLSRMGEEFLEARGVHARHRSPAEVYDLLCKTRAYDSTGDFPAILANVAHKVGLQAYQSTPRTFTVWAKRVDVADFKTAKLLQMSGGSQLSQIPENGEVSQAHFTDRGEDLTMKTYGKMFQLTRQAFVNDDLGMFTRWSQMALARCADKESDIVYTQLTTGQGSGVAGAVMSDGLQFFSSGHANYLTSGSALTNAGVGALYAKLLGQKDQDGNPISVQARTLLTCPEQYVAAAQVIGGTIPAQASGINPFANVLQPVVEPRLSANSTAAFYLIADSGLIWPVVYAFLDGNEGPMITTASPIDVDGMKFRVLHDFAAIPTEWAGIAKSDGV